MPNTIHVTTGYVRKKIWFGSDGYDDEYLAIQVGDVQVFESDGWKEGDKVRVVMEREQHAD